MIVLPESVISAKALCKEILDFYEKNREDLVWMEKNDYRGTDQTPVNYIADNYPKTFLSKKYNLNLLGVRKILDNDMYLDLGYVWHFNGTETSERIGYMKHCWDKIKDM